MKKYILTIIGNYDLEETKLIASSLEMVVDSAHLKFFQMSNGIIFHFASEVENQELFDYLTVSLSGISETFILSEFTDKMSFCLPKGVSEHLFDLENDNHSDIQFEPQPKSNLEFLDEDCDDEDYVALLLEDVKRRVKKPSLDQILDKISKTGVSSLSQFEKDVLEDYSKNQ